MVSGTAREKRLIEKVRQAIRPPFIGEVYEDAANLRLEKGYAVQGYFDVSPTKYLIEPMKDLRRPHVRKKLVLKAIQTAGSLAFADLFVPFIIRHDPGDILWLFAQGNELAEQYLAERFIPLMRSSPVMQTWISAAGRYGITKNTLMFPHMSVMVGGLHENNIHSLSKRYVIIDECWLAVAEKAGLIEKAEGRTKAFPKTKKIVLISQGGVAGSDWDREWEESDKKLWAWQCGGCKKHQVFEFSVRRDDGSWAGMKWETNDFTRPNGRWNYTEAGKTARLECKFCGHQTDDTPANRRRLDDTHTYIQTNPRADETVSGHQWPSIAKHDISFSSLVVRYLKAKDQQDEHGYMLPLVQFHQQELAVNWNEATAVDAIRVSAEPYEIHSEWAAEKYRFMTVDCQKDFKEFWFVIRAWAGDGESRQLDRGRLESWEEVARKQAEWKIKDQFVYVDAGYEQTQVADECIQHGHKGWVTSGGSRKCVWLCWNMLKGSGLETFEHVHSVTKVRELKPFSRGKYLTPSAMPTEVGRAKVGVPFFMFSALHVSDILCRHRDGKASKFLCLPDVADSSDPLSYTAQMRSHVRRKEKDDKGRLINIWIPISMGGDQKFSKKRPGHFWDAEKMQITAALRCGIIGGSTETEEEKEAA